MERKVPDKATSDKISFMTYIVPAFANAYKMNVQDAFFYLKNMAGGIFLMSIGGHFIPTTKFGQYTIFMKFVIKTEVKDEGLSRKLY
jgi:hypothetical protein